MTVVTTRPDTTLGSSGYTATGAASRHAALSDSSDSSYCTSVFAEYVDLGCDEPVIPSGARVTTVALRVRCAKTGGNPALEALLDLDGDTSGGFDLNQGSPPTLLGISWGSPTTVEVMRRSYTATPTTVRLVLQGHFAGGDTARIYEAYVDTTYVALPVTAPSAPTGTVTTTNKPQVAWANTLDSDGGAQTAFEVKFYTAAEYGGGGFDPDTTTVTTTQSGVTTGSATTWTPSATLADGTYRAYVRVAQTVNGSYHWSDWDYEGFVIDVLLPAIPDLVLYPDADDACTHLIVTGQSGDATTDALELQRSTDGGVTWEPVRLPAA